MSRPFRFGFSLDGLNDPDEIARRVRWAEDAGYSSVVMTDHFDDRHGPLVALTAAALATESLRVGTLVLANDYRHPAVLAKELASLDVISDGRLEIGIGAGWMASHGAAHVNRWQRVLVAFGEHDGTGVTGGAMTAAQAQQMADAHSSPVWDEVVVELTSLESATGVVVPVLSITGGSSVTEGANAVFTVSASPAPAAPLSVNLSVSQSGDWGATTGARTVTVPTTGTKTVTVATADDGTDEADGSVTAAVQTGAGYTVSPTAGSATVAVADDDDPPPPPPPPEEAVPVSLSASHTSIAEAGGEAKITITLGRALGAGEWVQVPLTVTGGIAGDHWTMEMRFADNPSGGAWQTGLAAEPQVLFIAGGETATLALTALPDAADRTITVSIGAGARAPTSGGLPGGTETTVESVSVTIIDDDWPRRPRPAARRGAARPAMPL